MNSTPITNGERLLTLACFVSPCLSFPCYGIISLYGGGCQWGVLGGEMPY